MSKSEAAAAARNAAHKVKRSRAKAKQRAVWRAALRKQEAALAASLRKKLAEEEAARKRNLQTALASARAAAQIQERAVAAGFRNLLPKAQRYVVTAAQDGSPLHAGFFSALQNYCRRKHAELVVIPYLYRALNARKQESEVVAERWAKELHPYLFAGRQLVAPGLAIVGDVKISPTRQSPLSSRDAMSLGASAIFAHPKLELRTVATLNGQPTVLTTTGTCTISDYVDADASKIAEFHHTIGACVVEIEDDGTFHLRQLNAVTDNGSFMDIDGFYTAASALGARPVLALALGDTHVKFTDPNVHKATFGQDGIVDTLRPQHIIYNDLDDGYAVNPHHGDPFLLLAKRAAGLGNVRKETLEAAQYIADNTPSYSQAVVSASNHNDFLYRWMCAAHTGKEQIGELDNAKFFHETALAMLDAGFIGEGGFEAADPFAIWGKRVAPKAWFLGRRESFMLGGVELSLHGDKGPNGARGSIRNLRRIGVKVIIGHSHSPGISEGAMQTGTSSRLRLEYNDGPSSWAHAHAVLYANGKRSLIFISHKGTWRL